MQGYGIPPYSLERRQWGDSSGDCVCSDPEDPAGHASFVSPALPSAGPPAAARGSAGTLGVGGPAHYGGAARAPPGTGTHVPALVASSLGLPARAAAGRIGGASAAAPAGIGAEACGC